MGDLDIVLEDERGQTRAIWKRSPAVEPLDNLFSELGIALEDTPKGTVWKRKRG